MEETFEIRRLAAGDTEPALKLAWEVFNEFEAADYNEDGIREFAAYLEPGHIQGKMEKDELFLWAAHIDGETTGMLVAGADCRIHLLFVAKQHHRKGIARLLLEQALGCLRGRCGCARVSVHSSPYAVEIYRKLGFAPTGGEQVVNGLRFTPMEMEL